MGDSFVSRGRDTCESSLESTSEGNYEHLLPNLNTLLDSMSGTRYLLLKTHDFTAAGDYMKTDTNSSQDKKPCSFQAKMAHMCKSTHPDSNGEEMNKQYDVFPPNHPDSRFQEPTNLFPYSNYERKLQYYMLIN